jgi:fructokinase
MFGGVEAGGTKFVCGLGTGPGDLRVETFPTLTPEETLPLIIDFLRSAGPSLKAIGIGSFGPVDLTPGSATFGFVTSTPKPGWANCDLRGTLLRALNVPTGFDTDVNAALLGEARWGAAQGLTDALYMTVGTGIGGGAIVHGRVAHGLVHPEMGHLLLPHDWSKDPFEGICPYHGDCLEGLACGPAIERRWGLPSRGLPEDHAAWELEARYLALGVTNLMVTLSPKRIILGGGVMQGRHLFPRIRREFTALLNGYVRHPAVTDHVDELIVPPALGGRAGVLGALVLAENALEGSTA